MNDWKPYRLDLPKRTIVFKKTWVDVIEHKKHNDFCRYKIGILNNEEKFVTTQYSKERLYFKDFEKVIY